MTRQLSFGCAIMVVAGSFEGECCVDQREVRQALGHIAQERAGLRVDLFGEEPDVVGQARRCPP